MAWTGFVAVGTVTAGVFTDSGLTRQPFAFGRPVSGEVYGVGPVISFGNGPVTFNALAFYTSLIGGFPDIVYPTQASRAIDAGMPVSINPTHIGIDHVNGAATNTGQTVDGVAAKYIAGVGLPPAPDNVATRAPTPRDDAAHGYSVGSFWRFGRVLYQSVRATAGAAVWKRFSATALPLDAVPTTAAAYGTVRLRAAYAGHAINVVRASDSTALDIDFRADGSLDYPTLDAFLQGTTGRIATWYDQSGNAANATQGTAANRPTIQATNLCGDARSIVFDTVINQAGLNTSESLVVPVGVAVASSNTASMFVVSRQGCNQDSWTCEWTNAAGHHMLLGCSPDYIAFGSNPGQMQLHFAQLGIPGIPGQVSAGVEGVVLGTNTQQMWYNDFNNSATNATSGTAQAGGAIGARSDGLVTGNCETACVLFYGRSLSAAETTALRASLYMAYSLTPQARDVITFDGDSITQGLNHSFNLSFPRKVCDLLGRPVMCSNNGFAGLPVSTMITNYPNYVAPSFNPSARNNILVIFGGTNDLANSITAVAAYALLTSYVAMAHATGFRVIVATMLPRVSGMSTPKNVEWNSYNALIRAGLAGADALADLQADPTMGPLAAASDTTLYPDSIHPNDTGYNYLAQIMADAIASVLR